MVPVREKAFVCVRLGEYNVYTPPVALTAVATGCAKLRFSNSVEKMIETRLDMRSDFVVVGDNFELVVSESNGTSCLSCSYDF